MDKEQEKLEFLGIFGILKESFKIILSHPKIFTKINFAFILPLTFLVLVNNEISKFLPHNLSNNSSSTLNTQESSPTKWALYWGFEVTYFMFIFVVIFDLLSISAVVYTAACIYSKKEITFKQVMTAIPKVWKRLITTLICNFCMTLMYSIVIVICWVIITRGIFSSNPIGSAIATTILAILFLIIIIYITIFWQLANVISVMENTCGFKAMKKSRQLVKGKLGIAIAKMLVLGIFQTPIFILYQELIKSDINNKIGIKILCIILILLLNPLITLYGLVVQSVFYCVCKSYHHENIDKSTLTNHLESFLGDYVPLLTEAVEIV
ncbi:hypothetical protein RND81_11G203200 [Saponaria officinalis]|uniref:Gustatory receptor n=1 Tax=Saponaria officinalis TaxID=3572 RepID=A0AAW1HPY4_SAPOF